MTPSSSPTQGQHNTRKLKVAVGPLFPHGKYFFFSWVGIGFYMGNRLQETQPPPKFPANALFTPRDKRAPCSEQSGLSFLLSFPPNLLLPSTSNEMAPCLSLRTSSPPPRRSALPPCVFPCRHPTQRFDAVSVQGTKFPPF